MQSAQKRNPVYNKGVGLHKRHKTDLIGDYYTSTSAPQNIKKADKENTTAYLDKFDKTKDIHDFWQNIRNITVHKNKIDALDSKARS